MVAFETLSHFFTGNLPILVHSYIGGTNYPFIKVVLILNQMSFLQLLIDVITKEKIVLKVYIYIYIYIYVCVCVCVCVLKR